MIRWFYRWMGWHLCERFTPWDDRTAVATRVATPIEQAVAGVRKVQYVVRWQERRCLDCGRMQQLELKHGARPVVEQENP